MSSVLTMQSFDVCSHCVCLRSSIYILDLLSKTKGLRHWISEYNLRVKLTQHSLLRSWKILTYSKIMLLFFLRQQLVLQKTSSLYQLWLGWVVHMIYSWYVLPSGSFKYRRLLLDNSTEIKTWKFSNSDQFSIVECQEGKNISLPSVLKRMMTI